MLRLFSYALHFTLAYEPVTGNLPCTSIKGYCFSRYCSVERQFSEITQAQSPRKSICETVFFPLRNSADSLSGQNFSPQKEQPTSKPALPRRSPRPLASLSRHSVQRFGASTPTWMRRPSSEVMVWQTNLPNSHTQMSTVESSLIFDC